MTSKRWLVGGDDPILRFIDEDGVLRKPTKEEIEHLERQRRAIAKRREDDLEPDP